MKQGCILFVFLFGLTNLYSQSITELTLNELEMRIAAGKDTTYIVNFWATWCRPCIAELPYFELVNDSLKEKKVKVLLVSVDFLSLKEEKLIPFVQKKGYKSELFILNEKNENEWINRVSPEWSGAIPATLILNTDKKYRRFYEQDFHDYPSLYSIFQTLISP